MSEKQINNFESNTNLDFDLNIYKKFNNDLKLLNDSELVDHFNNYGKQENRIYNLNILQQKSEHLIYFDINYYINNNLDIQFKTNYEYIIDYLENRLNDGRLISEELTNFKKIKKDKISHLFLNDDINNYLTNEVKYKIGLCETESANEWGEDSDIQKLIKSNNLILNVGAGYRKCKSRYFSLDNIINTEIFNYPTTDIVCDGNTLPFKNDSFDVVLSLAVLEHVKDPFNHANELLRVLKPNGILYVDVPFLQPYHGYPYHYYNMTTAGVKNLFGDKIQIIKHNIENWSKPIFTLTWFLNIYKESLDKNTKEKFINLTIKEILENGNNTNLDYVYKMDKNKEEIIACGSTLIGKKNKYEKNKS